MYKNLHLELQRKLDLPYGPNPHQGSGLYDDKENVEFMSINENQPILYEDIVDIDIGAKFISEFNEPVVTVVHFGEIIYAAYPDALDLLSLKKILPSCAIIYSGEVGNGLLSLEKEKIFPKLICGMSFSTYAERVVKEYNLKAVVSTLRHPSFLDIKATRLGYLISEEDNIQEDVITNFNRDEKLAYAIIKHNLSWSFAAVLEGQSVFVKRYYFDLKELFTGGLDISNLVVATDKPIEQREIDYVIKASSIIVPGTNLEEITSNFKLLKFEHFRV